MASKFVKATKKQARARIALQGPGGSGKTWTALELASGLGAKVAVIDSERGSASKYSDRFAFDVLELETFGPEKYMEAIQTAEREGYDVIVIDSLSHAWSGKDGVLERVDRKGGFAGWKDVTPLQNRLTDTILSCKAHVIATLRVKTEYAIEENSRGKMAPRKIGLAPVQKDGLEYEFDVVASLDANNNLSVEKTRCDALHGRTWTRQNPEIVQILRAWLTDGAPMIQPSASPAVAVPSAVPASTSAGPVDTNSQEHGSMKTTATTAATPVEHPGIDAAKRAFPAAVPLDPEREEALIEVRRLISSELHWEISTARAEIEKLFSPKKTTKELTTAEAVQLRNHLTALASVQPEVSA